MTIGPEPMIRILEMSALLGIYTSISGHGPSVGKAVLEFARRENNSRPSLLILKFFHHLHKILEQIVRIVRTRRRLWVILHAEEWQIAVAQTFKSVVV